MTTSSLTQADLAALLATTIDPAVRQQILDYLVATTAWTSPDDGSAIPVEIGSYIQMPDAAANV